MPTEWTADQMLELGLRHAHLESERLLEPLMETLVEEPVYEFHTVGLRLRGSGRIRRYYRQFFDGYMSRITGGRRLGSWVDERALVMENVIEIRGDTGNETHRILSILFAQDGRLGGERIYASEAVVRSMVGRMWDEL